MNTNLNQHPDPSTESTEPEPGSVDKTMEHRGGNPHGDDHHQVQVTVDGELKMLKKGNYTLLQLKATTQIALDLEVDQVVDGAFHPLDDNSHIHIKGGEVFISHVRQGGSS